MYIIETQAPANEPDLHWLSSRIHIPNDIHKDLGNMLCSELVGCYVWFLDKRSSLSLVVYRYAWYDKLFTYTPFPVQCQF